MNADGQDWAELCRSFRVRRGLKQEAMAQDFNVDQSTVSRWERGLREPGPSVKREILNDLHDKHQIGAESLYQLLLETSGAAVAIWTRDARLYGCSPLFAAELRSSGNNGTLVGRPAQELLGDGPIMDQAIAGLDSRGFFDGTVGIACFTFRPFVNPARREIGGRSTATVLPFKLSGNEIAMFCMYTHDSLAEAPEGSNDLEISWIDAEQHLSAVSFASP